MRVHTNVYSKPKGEWVKSTVIFGGKKKAYAYWTVPSITHVSESSWDSTKTKPGAEKSGCKWFYINVTFIKGFPKGTQNGCSRIMASFAPTICNDDILL